MEIKLIELPKISDDRGSISFMESSKDIPFPIERVYYIYDLKNDGKVRWEHAHFETEQALFCLHGTVDIGFDNGKENKCVSLGCANTGVLVPKMLWHWMENFSDNCILLVIASRKYEESDYIRSYEAYQSYLTPIP